MQGKTYWLVGASEGVGRALAQQLDQAGVRLILSARSAERLSDLAQELDPATRILPMDVSDPQSVAEAARVAGCPDGVIYCVGQYKPMPAGEWDCDVVESIVAANYLGALRVVGHIVPEMVSRDAGHIVLIGSLAGFRGLPGATGYGSSKAAVMHMAENLRADLHRTGVKVQLVNPGYVETRLTAKNEFKMPMIMTPADAAAHIFRAMQSKRFQTNFPRRFSWLFRGAQFLPASIYFRLFT